MNDEYFDAHIGISPSQSVHVRKYHSVICSGCTEAINFKITLGEFEKLEKQLHNKTMQNHDSQGVSGDTAQKS